MTTAVQYVFSAKDVTTKAFSAMSKRLDNLQKRTAKLGKSLNNVNSSFNKALLSITGVGIAIALPAKKMLDLASSVADSNKALSDQAKQLGVTRSQADIYNKTALAMGVSAETFSQSIVGLNKDLLLASKGVAGSMDKFRALGISIHGSNGKLLSSEQAFAKVADRIKAVKNPQDKLIVASHVFGENMAKELLPMLELGGEAFIKMQKTVAGLSRVLTEEQSTQLKFFQANKGLTASVFNQMKESLIVGVVPALNKLMTKFLAFYEKYKEVIHARLEKVFEKVAIWVDNLGNTFDKLTESDINRFFDRLGSLLELIPWILKGKVILAVLQFTASVLALGKALGGMVVLKSVGTALSMLSAKLGLTKLAMMAFNLVCSLNPIGLIVLAIGAFIAILAVLYHCFDPIKNALDEMWGKFIGWIDSLGTFGKAIKAVFSAIWAGIKAILNPFDTLMKGFNWVKSKFGGGNSEISAEVKENVENTWKMEQPNNQFDVNISGGIGVTASGGATVTKSNIDANGVGVNAGNGINS